MLGDLIVSILDWLESAEHFMYSQYTHLSLTTYFSSSNVIRCSLQPTNGNAVRSYQEPQDNSSVLVGSLSWPLPSATQPKTSGTIHGGVVSEVQQSLPVAPV